VRYDVVQLARDPGSLLRDGEPCLLVALALELRRAAAQLLGRTSRDERCCAGVARSLVGEVPRGSWRKRDRRPAQVRLVNRSLDAAGEEPLAQPLGIKVEKIRHAQDEAVGIGVELRRGSFAPSGSSSARTRFSGSSSGDIHAWSRIYRSRRRRGLRSRLDAMIGLS
jgi:hypothetical protein